MVSTKFNVKHQGKDIHHPPSTIYKWPLSDLPRWTLSLSFTKRQIFLRWLPFVTPTYKSTFHMFRTAALQSAQHVTWVLMQLGCQSRDPPHVSSAGADTVVQRYYGGAVRMQETLDKPRVSVRSGGHHSSGTQFTALMAKCTFVPQINQVSPIPRTPFWKKIFFIRFIATYDRKYYYRSDRISSF